jgi:hypothetical protein
MTRIACILGILERVTPNLLVLEGGKKILTAHTLNSLVPTLLSLLDCTQTFVPVIVLHTLEILLVLDGGEHAKAFAQTNSLLLLVKHFNTQSPPQFAALIMRLLDSKQKMLMHPSNIPAVCSLCVLLLTRAFPEMLCGCNILDRVMYCHRFSDEILQAVLQTPGLIRAAVTVLSQQSSDSSSQFQRPLKLVASIVHHATSPAQQLELVAGQDLLLVLTQLLYEHTKPHLTNEVCVTLRTMAGWVDTTSPPASTVNAFLQSGVVVLLVHCIRAAELKDPMHNVLLCEILLVLTLNASVEQLVILVRSGVVSTIVTLLREHTTLSEGLLVLTLQGVNRLLSLQCIVVEDAGDNKQQVNALSHNTHQLIGKCGGWKFIKVLTTSDNEIVKQLACQACHISQTF